MTINYNFDNKIKDFYYVADYFVKTYEIVKKNSINNKVLMQFFQRKNNIVLCGINEIIALLKFVCKDDYKLLEVKSLNDGDIINEFEPVLTIQGEYKYFGWLEGMIDGILSRSSSIATNSRNVYNVLNNKLAINMQDRGDHYKTLPSDGYASYIGGFKTFVTKSSIEYIENKDEVSVVGTMPHALIQMHNGNTLEAAKTFYKTYPNVNLVVLIDYENDCVKTAIELANHFKEKLFAVRIDTSENLIDKYLEKNKDKYKNKNLNGVNVTLVNEVRKALNENGCKHTKIIVSSGFDDKKIKHFEENNAPVDIYGIGYYLYSKVTSFTGDLVLLDGQKQAKFGRKIILNNKLIRRD